MLSQFSYQRAASIQEAVEAASRPQARLLAGGTDLLGCLRDRVFEANRLVSLNGLQALKGITPGAGGGLRIGALTTLNEIAENRQVIGGYRVLAQAAAAVGSPQLRNQGTLGGNLCQRPRCSYFRGDFPCRRKGGDTCFAASGDNQLHCIFGGSSCFMVHPSDTAAALVALDAKLNIAGRRGTRVVPAGSFFLLPAASLEKENVLQPGEIITEIVLDPPKPSVRSLYRKVRERGAFDFALAGAAIVLTIAGGNVLNARVVLSGVAPVPWRSAGAEKAIAGKPLSTEVILAAAQAAIQDAAPLAENEYKVPLVRGILEEALAALAA
ncbi:MAG: xanthine dehydrogenase family protein subunit M [Bryobacterales bacterium]|nr:xanthine dehydrogenase family protein subunit M [Bryobacterales bacterium]